MHAAQNSGILRMRDRKMKLAIMQPYFFPYIGYWQLLNAVDEYIVYDDVAYIKGGWINRNFILLNGEKHLLTLPLIDLSSFKKINEIFVTNNISIKTKLLKKITAAYKKAPYYEDVYPIIESVLLDNGYISEVLYRAILKIREYLGINTQIKLSSQINKNNELKGKDKVINICKLENADIYINAIGGQELYNKDEFENNGIKLEFLKCGDVKYKQFGNEFVSNLSIIDVMMFNSKDEILKLLGDCEFV